MSVTAITKDYAPPARDVVENFRGNQMVYIHWEDHMMFSAAMAFPFPPSMPFGAILNEILPTFYGMHPNFEKIEWDKVKWMLDGEDFTPDPEKTLEQQNIGHKSLIRFWTPGLHGYKGSYS